MVRKNKTAGLTGVKDASTRQTRESSFIDWSDRWCDSPRGAISSSPIIRSMFALIVCLSSVVRTFRLAYSH